MKRIALSMFNGEDPISCKSRVKIYFKVLEINEVMRVNLA